MIFEMAMSQKFHLTSFAANHEAAISWVNQQLTATGLVVKPSFDLQIAKSAHPDCNCPHHGTSKCDCQIVVLLVYSDQEGPISLVLHSQDGKTYLSMTGIWTSWAEDELASKIMNALGK
jgi:hypothetical protein